MYYRGGLIGILILFADIYAIINIAQSNASPGRKALWIVIVLVFPFLGWLLWLLVGPRTGRS
jgi:hypothetical protein